MSLIKKSFIWKMKYFFCYNVTRTLYSVLPLLFEYTQTEMLTRGITFCVTVIHIFRYRMKVIFERNMTPVLSELLWCQYKYIMHSLLLNYGLSIKQTLNEPSDLIAAIQWYKSGSIYFGVNVVVHIIHNKSWVSWGLSL